MEIVMPKMGESVNEGTIIKWHKKVGDKVERDEIIFEISTDKVDTEIPSPAAGVLQEIRVPEGETVEVGTVVALINENGGIVSDTKETHRIERIPEKTEPKLERQPVRHEDKVMQEPEVQRKNSPSSNGNGEIIEIAMPKMGESVMEGTIIKWHKKVGDKVGKDETIFEISTDKVDTEIPSPVEGIITEILVAEQETVEVGTIVAKVSTSTFAAHLKEKISATESTPEVNAPLVKMEKEVEGKVEIPSQMHEAFSTGKKHSTEIPVGDNSGFYSPLVLNIARKENISFDELSKIRGTGLEGRLTKKDLLAYLESTIERTDSSLSNKKIVPNSAEVRKEQLSSKMTTPSYTGVTMGGVERIPMDNIRQRIMQHMVNSRDTSVHVTTMVDVDMTRIHNFIEKNRDEYLKNEGVKLTYLAFIANASVRALRAYPLVNSSIEGTTILQKKFINLGIAVAVEPTGLIVPNIKSADERNIIGLAKAINDVATRARNKKLTPDDITGGTFTITNYGVFGAIFGTPIINQPEVAILGVGTITKKPVVIEVDGADTIAIKPIMILTLSHDHRLIDGMLGSNFIKYIKETLENFDPVSM